jgi:hypothetical protein
MAIDIAKLTHDALIESGCDPSIIAQLDCHSPIELNFKSQSAIKIMLFGNDSNQVQLECRLMEHVQWDLSQVAANLLPVILEPVAWSTTRATSMVMIDGVLKLSATLLEDYLTDGKHFADAIDGFYQRLVQVEQVLL